MKSVGKGRVVRLAPSRFATLALLGAARAALADPPLEVEAYDASLSPPPKDPFAAGSVVRADRLASPGLTAGDVLRTQPGVAVADTGGYGALSTASIRGATAAQTPVYLAGVRLNDDVGGWADLSLVPLWMLHRVEVYRSNAPLEADQLGIGGAIFFEPRRPHGAEGAVGEMLGSYGARSYWANVGAGNDRFAALAGVRVESATNDYSYLDNGGTNFTTANTKIATLSNADAHTIDGWVIATARVGEGARIDLLLNEVERTQGLPRALFPTLEARASVSRQLAAISAHLPCGKPGCEVTLTSSALVSRSAYDDPLREVDLETTHLDVTGTRVEETALAKVPLFERLELTPSVKASMEQLSLAPVAAPPLHAERASARAAVGAIYRPIDLLGVHLTASLECDGTAVTGNAPWSLKGPTGASSEALHPCGSVEPSARLGARFGTERIAVIANGARYVREPTLAELYGLSGAVRGNSTLEAEQGLTADLGIRASAPSSWPVPEAAIDLFGFVRSATDLIAYERTSLGFVQPFNVGAARFLGGELAASLRPVSLVRLELAVTLLDPRDTSASRTTVNDLLPYEARIIVTPRAELKLPVATRDLRAVKLAASYFYEAPRYADPAGLIVVPAQGSFDTEAELALLDDHLFVRGRLTNLFNQPRVDFIGYPLPGRSGYVNLEARW